MHTGFYGQTFECDCGRTHAITPAEILYADDALRRLPEVCRRAVGASPGGGPRRSAAVVADARTRAVAGAAAAEALRSDGWDVAEVLVPDPVPCRDPVCDEHTMRFVLERVAGRSLVLPVGSGVVNDLGKWTAHLAGAAYVSFATAASMNGYTSANVAAKVAGVKTLVEARPPHAVLTSPSLIAGAPNEMITAGLGDVLAKSVSSGDWKMNELLFGDYYCPRSVGLIADIEPLYLDGGGAIAAREPRAVEALYDALLLTGAAMTMAGSSAPASGGEHMISHSLDMLSDIDGRPHDLHGRQVGVGTILMAELYRRVLEVENPEPRVGEVRIDEAYWGPLAGAVAGHYAKKVERLHVAADALKRPGKWDELRRAVAPMLRTPERLRGCLQAAGGATTAAAIGADAPRLLGVLLHAHEIRGRFTILDLARLLGILPAAAGEVAAEAE